MLPTTYSGNQETPLMFIILLALREVSDLHPGKCENHLFQKKNHLNQTFIVRSHFNFQGCIWMLCFLWNPCCYVVRNWRCSSCNFVEISSLAGAGSEGGKLEQLGYVSKIPNHNTELVLMEEILHQCIFPIIYKVLYIPGGAKFLSSTVRSYPEVSISTSELERSFQTPTHTPLKISIEHSHGDLVQIIFLSFHGSWL